MNGIQRISMCDRAQERERARDACDNDALRQLSRETTARRPRYRRTSPEPLLGSETKSTLFTAGEAADECYTIVEGSVELTDSKGGTRVARAGDALGDSALALPCERVETARAQSARVVVFSIDRSTFKLSVGGFAALEDEKSTAVIERVAALTDALTPEQIAQLAPLAEFVVLKGNAVHTVTANSLVCSVTGAADYNGAVLSFLDSTGADALMGDVETPESVATAKKAGAEIMILSRAAVMPVLGNLRKLVEENAAGPSAEALAAAAASAAEAAASGRMVITNPDDIEKLRTLGMGSFGRVFVAKSKSEADAEIFAVKCIKKALVVEMQQEKSVMVEKSVMAECASPFVVDLVASYQEPHYLCLGMPIQRGGEVAHRLEAAVDDDDEPTGLPPFDAAFYTVGVALGAAHVHSKGFIWRDLKPENVVLGSDGYPRIVDFGLAKRLDLGAGKKAYTMCGTPEYIAPEIVKGTGHGPAADFYALGCFLYECLSGWTPFVRDDEYGLSIYRYVVKNPVAPPEGMATDAPAWLLLSAMLEKDPAKRIGTLKDGVSGIVAHPFIAALVDVAAVRDRSVDAPWKPDAPSGPLDFDHLKPDDEYEEDGEYEEFDGDNTVFAGFDDVQKKKGDAKSPLSDDVKKKKKKKKGKMKEPPNDDVKKKKKQGKAKALPFDDARIAEWKEHFREYDHDGGGTVDIEELKAVIASVGIEVSDADLNKALAEVDTDGSGELDFDEFVAMMKSIEEGGGGALGKLVNEVKRRKAHGAVCGEHISADDAKSLVSGGQKNKGEASNAERALIAKALSGSYAASGVVAGTIDFVINKMKRATFVAGSETKSTLFTAGEAADECYTIVEGSVELTDSKGGTRVARAGDALGDSALALPCERVETARAQSARVVVFSIDRSTFKLSVGGFAALEDEKSTAVIERVAALTDALTPEQIAQLAPLAEFVVLKGNAVHTVTANSLVCSVTGAADYNGAVLSFLDSTGADALMGDVETPESVATAKKAGAEIMILSRAAVMPVLGNLRKLVEENAAGPSAEALAAAAASAAEAAASGRMVITNPDDIEKLRTLGMGSFGRVFVAKSKSEADAEIFAVKCIKKALVVEMQQEKSVMVEKSVMAECASPFVVDLVASYQEPHYLCLGMPIQRGGEVAHRLEAAVDDDDEPTGLPPFDAAFYTVGVALGAAHVHSKGFIWRDLKPENVVLGSDGYPRIVDFGLAKRLDLGAGKKAYTMCGTPEYIAPEIVKGTGHGPAADFYALGCFLYECLSGWTPFVRDDEYGLSIYRYVVKNPVAPPEGMATDAPAWLLLSAMLEKDPAKRIGTLKDGVSGIVAHPFIAALVDVAAVRDRSVDAPWKPDAPSGPLDFDHLKPDDEYEEDGEYEEFDGDNAVFAGF